MQSLSLSHAILATLCFFDTLSYPLTAPEIEEFLFCHEEDTSIMRIIHALDLLARQGHIESSHGMFTLKGRSGLIQERLSKYVICEKKYRTACRVSYMLAHIPFIRLMCVVNTLAISNANSQSDIDLFIVAKRNHIWFVRFCVVVFLSIMRRRPTEKKKKNMICACFFASDDALDFSSLQIPPVSSGGLRDPYLAWWVSRFVPIYDQGGYAERLFTSNAWAQTLFHHRRLYRTAKERTVFLSFFAKGLKQLMEYMLRVLGGFVENACRALQLALLPDSIRVLRNRDTRVVIDDSILKFHVRDTREHIRKKFFDMCNTYGIHFAR